MTLLAQVISILGPSKAWIDPASFTFSVDHLTRPPHSCRQGGITALLSLELQSHVHLDWYHTIRPQHLTPRMSHSILGVPKSKTATACKSSPPSHLVLKLQSNVVTLSHAHVGRHHHLHLHNEAGAEVVRAHLSIGWLESRATSH